jgi:hypothetical protein
MGFGTPFTTEQVPNCGLRHVREKLTVGAHLCHRARLEGVVGLGHLLCGLRKVGLDGGIRTLNGNGNGRRRTGRRRLSGGRRWQGGQQGYGCCCETNHAHLDAPSKKRSKTP